MPRVIALSFVFAFLSTLIANCGPSPECKRFLDLTREQREMEFKGYPLDRQLEAYLCGMEGEPPELGLADSFADQGQSVVAPTLDRLKSSKNLHDQSSLIYLLRILSDRGFLKGRKDVIADISDVIDTMKLDNIREASLEELKKIQINSGVPPFTYTR